MGYQSLKQAIHAQGLSVRELARRAGVPAMTVSNFTSGRNNLAPLKTYIAIAQGLGISLDELADILLCEQDISTETVSALDVQVITNSSADALQNRNQVSTLPSDKTKTGLFLLRLRKPTTQAPRAFRVA